MSEMQINIMAMAHKATEFDYIQEILKYYLETTRDRAIVQVENNWKVLRISKADTSYSSPSYAACLEWALEQPMIETDNQDE
jgi:hypothetical protein